MNNTQTTTTHLTLFQKRMLVLNFLLQHQECTKSELMTQTGLTSDTIDDCLNDIYEYYPFERTQGRYATIKLLVNNYSTPPLNIRDMEVLSLILQYYPLPREISRELSSIIWKLQRHLSPGKLQPKEAEAPIPTGDLQDRIRVFTQQIMENLLHLQSASLEDLSHLNDSLDPANFGSDAIEALLLNQVKPFFPCSECTSCFGECPMETEECYSCTDRFIRYFSEKK